MGLFASYWNTPFSFLFSTANEVLLEIIYSRVSHVLAATFATPFKLFTAHLLIGLVGGAVAGAVLGLLFALLRVRLKCLMAWYVAVVFLPFTFAYCLLWYLHGKFVNGTPWLATVVLIAVVVSVLAGLATAVVCRLLRFAGAGGARIAPWIRRLATAAVGLQLVLFAIGTGRGLGKDEHVASTHLPPKEKYKVMFVGFDAASWAYMRPLMDAGDLPNLKRLAEEGVSGTLRSTLPPIESPKVWTTVATGMRPATHGIHGFTQRMPDSDELVPVSNDMRKAAAFWEIASQQGLEVDVLSWYVTWPAQVINGVFVSDRLLFPQAGATVFPTALEEVIHGYDESYLASRDEILKRLTPYPYNPDFSSSTPSSPNFFKDEHMSILEYSYRKDMVTFEAAMELLSARQPDIFAVYFEGIDRASHRFIRSGFARRHPWLSAKLYPDLDSEELTLFGEVLRQTYMQADEWLGELVAMVDDKTAVLVASDHGFGLRKLWEIHLYLDELLDFVGYLSHESPQSKDVVWGDTKLYDGYRAFRKPGKVMVNLSGRESHGVVEQGDVRALLEDARDVLSGLRCRSGDAVFNSVKITSGAGQKSSSGDLEVEFNEACLADTVEYRGEAFPVSGFTKAEWMPGNHRIDGMFIGYGGPFKRGAEVHCAGVRDISPTILKLAGIPPSRVMDGRPLDRAFRASSRKNLVRGLVGAYDKEEFAGAQELESTPADSVIMHQLKALGYIK
jgi:predicted AlkP superfamily phosphohydrolase/phosphomutase